MKFARVIAGIFAAVGLVLMLGTVGISLYGLNHPTLAVEIPRRRKIARSSWPKPCPGEIWRQRPSFWMVSRVGGGQCAL